jgi:hypothetical protein
MSSSSVWLTEQGAIRDNSGGTSRTPDETAHDVAQLVELPGFSKRIKRFYYFSWRGGSSWDSGLIDYKTDKKRERMYNTFRDALPQWP